MELNKNHFNENDATIIGFNDTSSKPARCICLNVDLAGKVVQIELAPQNGLLGRPWTHQMGTIVSTLYQCLKFPLATKIRKVKSNQRVAYLINEDDFTNIKPSKVQGRYILSIATK